MTSLLTAVGVLARWRARLAWVTLTLVVAVAGVVVCLRVASLRFKEREARARAIESERQVMEVLRAMSSVDGGREDLGPGDFPPWYGRLPAPRNRAPWGAPGRP